MVELNQVHRSTKNESAEREFMDVLRKLFEEHFQMPVERIQPLQGELGGSGRNILRLSAGKTTAIGILYGVREENLAFLSFSRHFQGTVCRCRKFMPRI